MASRAPSSTPTNMPSTPACRPGVTGTRAVCQNEAIRPRRGRRRLLRGPRQYPGRFLVTAAILAPPSSRHLTRQVAALSLRLPVRAQRSSARQSPAQRSHRRPGCVTDPAPPRNPTRATGFCSPRPVFPSSLACPSCNHLKKRSGRRRAEAIYVARVARFGGSITEPACIVASGLSRFVLVCYTRRLSFKWEIGSFRTYLGNLPLIMNWIVVGAAGVHGSLEHLPKDVFSLRLGGALGHHLFCLRIAFQRLGCGRVGIDLISTGVLRSIDVRLRDASHPASNLAESRHAASLAIIFSQRPLGNVCRAASILLFP